MPSLNVSLASVVVKFSSGDSVTLLLFPWNTFFTVASTELNYVQKISRAIFSDSVKSCQQELQLQTTKNISF